ncbi:hypothetical protein [Oleiagrimonas sp. C23AA]|uniref:hypothetical protein n=1 Tax=Oleiagrimonas sp. C23AA TaxID=2719047 RepID=UPI001421443D|nr:hypothetical protein [Oleiagrimonas sp. C23AA]NII10031.1 hypothetical protein [Oleiagrimonas sp. C23AA]
MNVDDIHVWWAVAFALVGRLLDLGSTWLQTPSLRLEGNALVRRFGWPCAWASVLLALAGFISPGLGIVVAVMSCCAAASNIQGALIVNYLCGEHAFSALMAQHAKPLNLRRSLRDTLLLALPMLLVGVALMVTRDRPLDTVAGCIGLGIVTYVLGVSVHRTLGLVRRYRRERVRGRLMERPTA